MFHGCTMDRRPWEGRAAQAATIHARFAVLLCRGTDRLPLLWRRWHNKIAARPPRHKGPNGLLFWRCV
jgi:hypothetical protein